MIFLAVLVLPFLAGLTSLSLPSFPRHTFLAILSLLSSPSFPRHPFLDVFTSLCPSLPLLAILSSLSLPRCPYFPFLAILPSLSIPRCPYLPFSLSLPFLPSLKQKLSSPSFPCCPYLSFLSFLGIRAIASTTASIKNLNKSFFFRTHTLWNSLPFDIRNSMRLSQFKIKLAKHFCLTKSSLSTNGHSSHQMKGAKFLTKSNYALERVLQNLVWDSGGHLVLNSNT